MNLFNERLRIFKYEDISDVTDSLINTIEKARTFFTGKYPDRTFTVLNIHCLSNHSARITVETNVVVNPTDKITYYHAYSFGDICELILKENPSVILIYDPMRISDWEDAKKKYVELQAIASDKEKIHTLLYMENLSECDTLTLKPGEKITGRYGDKSVIPAIHNYIGKCFSIPFADPTLCTAFKSQVDGIYLHFHEFNSGLSLSVQMVNAVRDFYSDAILKKNVAVFYECGIDQILIKQMITSDADFTAFYDMIYVYPGFNACGLAHGFDTCFLICESIDHAYHAVSLLKDNHAIENGHIFVFIQSEEKER